MNKNAKRNKSAKPEKAMRILEKDFVYGKWFKEGYSQAKKIRGVHEVSIYKCAKKKAEIISNEICNKWIQKANNCKSRRKLFFGGA